MNGILLAVVFLASQDDAARFVEKLRSDKVEEREEAYLQLKDFGKDAIPALVKRLTDEDNALRLGVLETIRRLRARDAAPHVVPLLRHPSLGWQAMATLDDLGAKDVAPDLLKLLGDSDVGVRRHALYLLNSLHVREAVPEAVRFLADQDADVRSVAVSLLGHLGDADRVPAVLERLKDPEARVRAEALWSLRKLEARESCARIEPLLADPDPYVRSAAVRALGEFDPKGTVALLEKSLKDPDKLARREAAIALATLSGKDARPLLEPLLRDPVPEVQIWTAGLLCRSGIREPAGIVLSAEARLCPEGLFWLNALRRPDLWGRLETERIEALPEGRPEESFVLLAKAAGLTLELSPEEAGKRAYVGNSCFRRHGGRVSLLKTIEEVQFPHSRQVILEPDRLRVVSRDEALKFWKAWWEAEKK
jgi:HEAT repeat protein